MPSRRLDLCISNLLEWLRRGADVDSLMLKFFQGGNPVSVLGGVNVPDSSRKADGARELRQQYLPVPEVPRGHVHFETLEEPVPVLHERDDLGLVELSSVSADDGLSPYQLREFGGALLLWSLPEAKHPRRGSVGISLPQGG